MDQSLKDFRAAVQRALQTGDSGAVATKETQKRLALSKGWVSARSLRTAWEADTSAEDAELPLQTPTKRK